MSSPGGVSSGRSTAVRTPTGNIAPQQVQQPAIRLANLSPGSSTTTNTNANPGASNASPSSATANAPASSSTITAYLHPQTSVPRQTSSDRKEFILFTATTMITLLAFFAAVAFGIGAWAGMNVANKYAIGSYQLALWGICHDHDVSKLRVLILGRSGI